MELIEARLLSAPSCRAGLAPHVVADSRYGGVPPQRIQMITGAGGRRRSLRHFRSDGGLRAGGRRSHHASGSGDPGNPIDACALGARPPGGDGLGIRSEMPRSPGAEPLGRHSPIRELNDTGGGDHLWRWPRAAYRRSRMVRSDRRTGHGVLSREHRYVRSGTATPEVLGEVIATSAREGAVTSFAKPPLYTEDHMAHVGVLGALPIRGIYAASSTTRLTSTSSGGAVGDHADQPDGEESQARLLEGDRGDAGGGIRGGGDAARLFNNASLGLVAGRLHR